MIAEIESLVRNAQSLKAAGRVDDAINAWRNVVACDPENLFYRHDLAAVLGDAGRNTEAANFAVSAIASGLDRPETYLVYARALAGLLDLDGAENAYRTVIAKAPDHAIAHREFAQMIWMRTGDPERSEAPILDAIAKRPDNLNLKVLRAEIRGQTGDAQAQYALLAELIQGVGRHPQICYFAARAALANNKYSLALEYAQAASAGAPDQDDVVATHVTALLANEKALPALRLIEKLRARQPANQYFIALQATAWRLCGDERYYQYFNYEELVWAASLEPPRGWSTLESYLEDLGRALTESHCYREHPFFLSVRHGSQIASITKSDNPAMRAYREAVRGPLEKYFERLGHGDDPLRERFTGDGDILEAWSVLLPPSGFHVNHVHPEGWVSSACHIQPAAEDPENPRAGWLKFGEPGCATVPALPAERHIKPEAGQMIMFPSYMWHGTEPFTKGRARLTVAADFAPKSPAD